jgi:PhnB protein
MSNKVKPIPAGNHTVTPYIVVKGAANAIAFYKKAFGAEEVACMPGFDGQSIMHAELKVGDSLIYLADECPSGMGNPSPATLGGTTVGLHLFVENVDAAYDRAVTAGAKSQLPPQNMFWGDRFSKVVDPFGHVWSLATHIEDVPPEEMGRRAAACMAEMAKNLPQKVG